MEAEFLGSRGRSDVRRSWLVLGVRCVVSWSTFKVRPVSSLGDGVTLGTVGCGRSESLEELVQVL